MTCHRTTEPLRFEIAIGPAERGDHAYLNSYYDRAAEVSDLAALRQPGPARWPAIETQAVTGADNAAFAVDELTVPEDNPWRSYLRPSGLDFLPDGRAVVASLSGDVWLVDGIGETLGTLRWKRFATGLNQPLGVRVVDGRIYINGRDQITRLHDTNGDGEADFYENFNNEVHGRDELPRVRAQPRNRLEGQLLFREGDAVATRIARREGGDHAAPRRAVPPSARWLEAGGHRGRPAQSRTG